jgi:CheY-like chemotaxis protein
MMTGPASLSALLLDDNGVACDAYKQLIEGQGPFSIVAETDGVRAHSLAMKQLFDVVIIDAKLDYKGMEFGGLRLADELRPRYGSESILVVSRFITRSMMQLYQSPHEFLEKPDSSSINTFSKEVCNRLLRMRQRQFVFVAMPFSGRLDALYETAVVPAVQELGYQCARMDEVIHSRESYAELVEHLKTCKLVICLADDANPNVYYEVGYAHSLAKEVLIVAERLDELRFDIRGRYAIAYGRNPEVVRTELVERIHRMKHTRPLA